MPESATAWASYAEALYRLGAAAQAAEVYQKVVAVSPSRLARLHLAKCLAADGRARGAVTLLALVGEPSAMELEALVLASQVRNLLGQHAAALDLAEQAWRQRPQEPALIYNLAMCRRACGQFEAAVADLDAVLAQEPCDWAAWKNRSDLRRARPQDNHIAALHRARPEADADPDGFVLMSAALAKEYEDTGDHAAAFEAAQAAAQVRRRGLAYDVDVDVEAMGAIAAAFDAECLAAAAPIPRPGDPAPIFILGLPRSGSTLVERMIAGHPAVTACGELKDLPKLFRHALRRQTGGAPIPRQDLAGRSAGLDMGDLGLAYLDGVAARGVVTPWFTDKLPENFLNIGLIHMALPQARILHIHRAPMDAGWGLYKRVFGDGHPYSYDLEEIADYVAAYRRLMDHWRRSLPPGRMIEVAYEDLVADPVTVGSVLFDALGLDWRDAYARVEESRVATDTASAAQVRQPIHRGGVGAWRRVERQLAPLVEAFRARGVEVEA